MIPATAASNHIDDLNRFLETARFYAAGDEFWFRRLEAEAKKLSNVDALSAHNVLALLYSVAGDHAKAVHHIDCAINLSPAALFLCNKATILSNLGYFSEAQVWWRKGAAPERGEFTSRWHIGLMGSFRLLSDYFSIAQKMGLEKLSAVDGTRIDNVVAFLNRHSIADDVIAAMLDVAGIMLRENRMFFMGDGPSISLWDDDQLEQHLAITLRVPLTSAKTLELDEELGHRLFANVANMPFAVMLNFESGLPSNERFAERPAVAG